MRISPPLRALRITLAPCHDLAAVAQAWRALEPRTDASFLRSWTWVGCLAERRFTRPVLLEARWRDRVVALGLLNRRGWLLEPDTLRLGESGDPALDAVFVEHNGLLVERGHSDLLTTHCLRMLALARLAGRPAWLGRRVLLPGIDERFAHALARGGAVRVRASATRVAPIVDLASIRAGGGSFRASLSANTRAQLGRSDRGHAATGELRLERAETPDIAHRYLDALAGLHQQTWQRRNRPGAFANPAFRSFHHALIDRGFTDGTIDLLRVAAGGHVVGYLYNFRYRGRISAYQSGFSYAAHDNKLKPGLTCHAMAIDQALAEGCEVYDFLAGDGRYKRSLANGAETLCWLEMLPPFSPRGMIRRLLAAFTGS